MSTGAYDIPGVTCTAESSKAIRCEGGLFKKEQWIPKSVLHEDSEVFDADENSTGKLVVLEWFGEKLEREGAL